MKRADLIRHLERHGCQFLREGGHHTVYVNRKASKSSSVPRHREVNDFLCRKICRRFTNSASQVAKKELRRAWADHILRKIQDVLETKQGWARQFGSKTKVLFQEGMALWRTRKSLPVAEFTAKADEIKAKVTHHLRDRILEDDDNQKLLNGLGAQNDKGHLMRFLSARRARTHEQSGRTHVASGGDRAKGVAVFEERGRCAYLCCLRQHRPDGSQGRRFHYRRFQAPPVRIHNRADRVIGIL